MSEREARHLALEVPETEQLRAFLEEASMRDADLDGLERRLEGGPGQDPGLLAASALVLGRAGDLARAPALERLSAKLEAAGHFDHAAAIQLAWALCHAHPDRLGVERADAGYRFVDRQRGATYYVSDPVAGRWHAQGRWGPPLRPHRERPPRLARAGDDLDALAELAEAGGVILVCFEPSRFRAPEPPLRLTLAGFARDPDLRVLVRWSAVRSIGEVLSPRGSRAAIETSEPPLTVLPESAMLPQKDLLRLMSRLLKSARP